jgi:hypothetical protein
VRWVVAPLGWRDSGERPAALLRAALRRAALAAAAGPPHPPAPDGGPPLGWLHRDPGPGRLPLHSALHPLTGDQLLTTDRWEAVDLGYGEPVLLGHLEAAAPVTGRLGVIARPLLLVASRFGRRVRSGGP